MFVVVDPIQTVVGKIAYDRQTRGAFYYKFHVEVSFKFDDGAHFSRVDLNTYCIAFVAIPTNISFVCRVRRMEDEATQYIRWTKMLEFQERKGAPSSSISDS